MPAKTASQDLDRYVHEVAAIVASQQEPEATAAQVERCHRELMATGFEMPAAYRTLHPHVAYSRNLIYQDPELHFSIISIVWGAFQETKVHDHLSWCVVGAIEGTVLSHNYDRLDDGSDPEQACLRIRTASFLREGETMFVTPPPSSNIHKLGNTSQETAITLHTYGDPGNKARIFDPSSGRVSLSELVFHNR